MQGSAEPEVSALAAPTSSGIWQPISFGPLGASGGKPTASAAALTVKAAGERFGQPVPRLRRPRFFILEIMHHCVALPWNTKTGSLPRPAGCGPASAGVFAVIGGGGRVEGAQLC